MANNQHAVSAPADPAPGGAAPVSRPLAAIAAMVASTACYALSDTTAKTMLADYSVLQVTWARYAFSLAIWLPVIIKGAGGVPWRSCRPIFQAARSVMMVVAAGLFFLALTRLPLAEVTAIFYVEPFILTALAVPILGARVGPRRWAAVAVGFAGLLLIVRPGSAVADWFALLPLISAALFAFYGVTTRALGPFDGPMTSFFYLLAVGTTFMTALVWLDWTTPDLAGLGLMVAIGIFGGAAMYFLILAVTLASPPVMAPFRYGQIAFATVLGFVVFGELPDGWALAGMAVIAGAGSYVWRRERAAQVRTG